MMRNRALDTIRVKVAQDVEGEGKKFHMILSELQNSCRTV